MVIDYPARLSWKSLYIAHPDRQRYRVANIYSLTLAYTWRIFYSSYFYKIVGLYIILYTILHAIELTRGLFWLASIVDPVAAAWQTGISYINRVRYRIKFRSTAWFLCFEVAYGSSKHSINGCERSSFPVLTFLSAIYMGYIGPKTPRTSCRLPQDLCYIYWCTIESCSPTPRNCEL